jgi:hypothetical protein
VRRLRRFKEQLTVLGISLLFILLAVQLGREAFGIAHGYPALAEPERGANRELLHRAGGLTAFGAPVDVRRWDEAIESGAANVHVIEPSPDWAPREVGQLGLGDGVVPLARIRGGSIAIVHPGQEWVRGDRVALLLRVPADADGVTALLAAATRGVEA